SRVALVVPEVGQEFADAVALGDLFQEAEGDLVLGRDPVGDIFRLAHVVFQPAVRVGDLGAVQFIHVICVPSRGIGGGHLGNCRGGPSSGDGDCDQTCKPWHAKHSSQVAQGTVTRPLVIPTMEDYKKSDPRPTKCSLQVFMSATKKLLAFDLGAESGRG